MKLTRVLLTAAFALSLLSAAVQADELLGNGGFEDPLAPENTNPIGNWSGFSGSNGGPAPPPPVQDATNPNSGAFHLLAAFNGEDAAFAGIQQSVDNIITGEDYEFKLFAATDGNPLGIGVEYRIEWLDAEGAFVGGQFDNNIDITASLSGTYVEFSQTRTAPVGATQLRAVLALQSFGGGDNTGTVFVDDTSVHGPAAIPEPTSAGLVALCVMGLVARRRR